ncbi:MAG: fused MFS/spermidine synthase, partial [Candidatus Riflebacteria bacterium]|nr:fused MFS/spermidine synthase [Candidatus Riflebacteria bacterium]
MSSASLHARVVTALLLSGGAGLVYETVWARALVRYTGSTAFSVAVILAAFMGGMAAGAWIGGRIADRSRRPLVWYAGLEGCLGLCGLSMPWAIGAMGSLYLAMASGVEAPEPVLALLRGAVFLALLAVPALLMGATFPLACRVVVQRHSDVQGGVSGLYAANSAGAVVGCLATTFWLIPAFGLAAGSCVGAGLNLAAAAVALSS